MPNAPLVSLDYWRRHALQLVDGLLQRVDELSVSDYPGTTPNEIIQFLQSFLRELEHVISRTNSEDRLKVVSNLVAELGVFLEWLDNAHTGQTPRGLVKVLCDLIERQDPSARVIARPQAKYNYSILDLGQILKAIVRDFVPQSKQAAFNAQLTSSIKLISFPRIDRDNLLAHTVFGHELGHPIADAYLSWEAAQAQHQNDHAEIQKKVLALVASSQQPPGTDQAAQLAACTKVFNRILQIRKRALEELISDAVGILIFGPSAFFAMFELLWSSNWDAAPRADEWYPPPRYRLRLMLKLLDDLKFLAVICEDDEKKFPTSYSSATRHFVEEARRLAAATTDIDAINTSPLTKIAYDWMESSLGEAVKFATDRTTSIAYKSDALAAQIGPLLQRLELGIPPNEVGDPLNPQVVDYRASLLVAWIYKLRGTNSLTGEPLSKTEIGRLNMKTMLAVEYVLLQSEYAGHFAKEHAQKAGANA